MGALCLGCTPAFPGPRVHVRWEQARPSASAEGLGSPPEVLHPETHRVHTPPTSAPGLRSPLPHLRRVMARRIHICTWTGCALSIRYGRRNRPPTTDAPTPPLLRPSPTDAADVPSPAVVAVGRGPSLGDSEAVAPDEVAGRPNLTRRKSHVAVAPWPCRIPPYRIWRRPVLGLVGLGLGRHGFAAVGAIVVERSPSQARRKLFVACCILRAPDVAWCMLPHAARRVPNSGCCVSQS